MNDIIPSVGEAVEQLDSSNPVAGNVKWYNHFGKQFSSLLRS